MSQYTARKFNQGSYNSSDDWAKKIFSDYILKRNHEIISDVEDYKHGIITEKNGEKFFFELEVKRNYPFTKKETYPFGTVSFLGRKKRLHEINKFFYVIICKETQWAICCESSRIFDKQYMEQVEINTIHTEGIDQFYRVPINECLFFNLNSE